MNVLVESQIQSQTFFFISSIGFIFLWVLIAIFLIYLIRATSTFSRIMDKIEKDVNKIGDTTKEMVEDMKDSMIYRMLFKKKRSRKESE